MNVPRARTDISYSKEQLMFHEAIQLAVKQLSPFFIDGTDCIIRTKNTKTTHIKSANYPDPYPLPYPGITEDTCKIKTEKVRDQNIILIDDIYTKTVNIDEDCIQTLFNHGAKNVVLYTIAYTRRWTF